MKKEYTFKEWAIENLKDYSPNMKVYNGDIDCSAQSKEIVVGEGDHGMSGRYDIYETIYINQLTSLEGCPKIVNGSFNCSHNLLTSLEYAPKEVKGNFDCSNNELKSLDNLPQVDGKVISSNNKFHIQETKLNKKRKKKKKNTTSSTTQSNSRKKRCTKKR